MYWLEYILSSGEQFIHWIELSAVWTKAASPATCSAVNARSITNLAPRVNKADDITNS